MSKTLKVKLFGALVGFVASVVISLFLGELFFSDYWPSVCGVYATGAATAVILHAIYVYLYSFKPKG